MLKLVQELLQEREASRAELQHFDDEKPDGVHTTVLLQDFRSNVSPIREVGCTARFRVSDTRCGTYVI